MQRHSHVYHSHVYDLGFDMRTENEPPALVLSVPLQRSEEFIADIITVAERAEAATRDDRIKYLGDAAPLCHESDMFSEFIGFRRSCRVVRDDTEVCFVMDLTGPECARPIALTLSYLLLAGNAHLYDGNTSNRAQYVTLTTTASVRDGYGHAVGATIEPAFHAWLIARGTRRIDVRHSLMGEIVPMPEEVLATMRTAWTWLAPKVHPWHERDITGWITTDGRFVLNCPGNACDIAIYPDGYDVRSPYGAEMHCHNLDTATQQLTLLSGLATLAELARRDVS